MGRKRLAYALLAYAVAVALLFLPRCVRAAEAPGCAQEPGRVCCTTDTFDGLSTALLDLKARVDACESRSPARCTLPPPIPAAPPAAGRPLLGLGTSVASTLLLVTAVLAPLPSELRGTLGTLALSGYTASVYLVLP